LNSGQQTASNKQQAANSKQQARSSKQRAASNKKERLSSTTCSLTKKRSGGACGAAGAFF